MVYISFGLTLAIVISLIGILVYSVVSKNRIWPPPSQGTWQFVLTWTLFLLAFGLYLVVGVLDWNRLNWPASVRWPVGGSLILLGNLLAWVAVWQLGVGRTSGKEGALMTGGLYKISRNPQYIGDILITLGWMIFSASVWGMPLMLGGVIAFALTPFAEEPWLEELHGEEYRNYKSEVPRFVLF